MSRSKWKRPYVDPTFMNLSKNKAITVSRGSEILPSFVNKTFSIYNGKSFFAVLITSKMIGHKFGEFVFTRKQFIFKKNKKYGPKN